MTFGIGHIVRIYRTADCFHVFHRLRLLMPLASRCCCRCQSGFSFFYSWMLKNGKIGRALTECLFFRLLALRSFAFIMLCGVGRAESQLRRNAHALLPIKIIGNVFFFRRRPIHDLNAAEPVCQVSQHC